MFKLSVISATNDHHRNVSGELLTEITSSASMSFSTEQGVLPKLLVISKRPRGHLIDELAAAAMTVDEICVALRLLSNFL